MPSELPIIVRVFGDGTAPTDVPVTPETTCSDVIQCCRDPGEENCDLIAFCPDKGECSLRETDHPLEILQRWGSGRLVLRYTTLSTNGGTFEKRNGMKEPEPLPGDGVQLTLHELRAMACRQQTQIDSQQQMLAAKEQRLRWLKEQEVRQQRVHAESERLRRLRDRVDAQELKLRKLRALRGQVDNQKQNNISLTSDLDSIRALFNEKEKELSMAVAKVEELTRQLEELRRGRSAAAAAAREPPPASALELDKLRRELMYRNKLNEQQNLRLSQQREALTARQEEMSAIDKRISELQERLHRKRMLNQQLANQISATYQKATYHQLVRLTGGSTDQTTPTSPPNNYPNHPNHPTAHMQLQQQQQQHSRKANINHHPPPNGNNNLLHQLAASYNNSSTLASMLQRGNIAAVEPYNHIPAPQPKQPGPQTGQSQVQLEVVGMPVSAQAQNLQHLQQQHQQHHSPNVNCSGGNSAKGSPPMGHQGQVNMTLDQQHQLNLQLQKNSIHQMKEDLQYKLHQDESEEFYKNQHLSKSDPKYQTLPYNTKFTVNLLTSTSKDPGLHTNQMILHNKDNPNNSYNYNNNFTKDQSPSTNQIKESPTSVHHLSTTVTTKDQHNLSMSSNVITKDHNLNMSTNVITKDQHNLNMSTNVITKDQHSLNVSSNVITKDHNLNMSSYNQQQSPQMVGKDVVDLNGNNSKNKNVMAISNALQMAEQLSGGGKVCSGGGGGLLQCAVTSSAAGYQQQKPITTTSTNHNQPTAAATNINKLSNIYQTSSTKVQPVEPQILSTNTQQIPQNSILNTINASLINSTQCSLLGTPMSIPPPLPPSITTSSTVLTSATNTTLLSSGLHTVTSNSTVSNCSGSNIASIISSINNNTLNLNNNNQGVLDKGLIGDKLIVSPKPALPPKPSPPQNTGLTFGVNNAIKLPPRQMQSQQNQLQMIEQQRDDQQNATITGNDASPPPPPPLTQPPPDDDVTNTQQTSPPKPPQKLPNSSTVSSNQPQQNLSVTSSPTVNTLTSIITTTVKEPSNQGSVNVIKAKPLTLRKQLLSEQPKLRTTSSRLNGLIANSMQHKKHQQQSTELPSSSNNATDLPDNVSAANNDKLSSSDDSSSVTSSEVGSGSSNGSSSNAVRLRHPPTGGAKKGNLKNKSGGNGGSRRVSFDPLALLLDASLEGELELVKKTATQVANPSAANDEGITALHNAICAGHLDIVRFLVGHGCDVNAPDSDGWTPLHCAASCNNVAMVRFLVERGACIFAATLSDRETAAEKCEEDEEGFDGCSEYLYSVQEKLGILSNGAVYAVFDYGAQNPDELGFRAGQQLTVLRKGDETEREWWWCRLDDKEGYVPRNLLGLFPRVIPNSNSTEDVSY